MSERLTVIAGPMFAGKTERLISQILRGEAAEMEIQTFKHFFDDRYPNGIHCLESKNGLSYPTCAVRSAREVWEKVEPGTNLVAIDEIQFFDSEIVAVVDDLIHRNIRVLVAGLPSDFRHEGFGKMPELYARADHRISLTAVCKVPENGGMCPLEATRTQRLTNDVPSSYDEPTIVVGSEGVYEARCHKHYESPNRPRYK